MNNASDSFSIDPVYLFDSEPVNDPADLPATNRDGNLIAGAKALEVKSVGGSIYSLRSISSSISFYYIRGPFLSIKPNHSEP